MRSLVPLFCIFALGLFILAGIACTNSPATPKDISPKKEITISTLGEAMMFDKNELYVKSGEEITLTFVNNASFLKHNFVLVKPGKGEEVGRAGTKAGEAGDFTPNSPDVIAHTKLIGHGKEILKFKAPAPGDYPYICSFPGHYNVMKGILHSLP